MELKIGSDEASFLKFDRRESSESNEASFKNECKCQRTEKK
jgi:hypothetical protein